MDRGITSILDAARDRLDEAGEFVAVGMLSEADRALESARRILRDGERRLARLREDRP